MKLEKSKILEEAFSLLNEVGLEKLNLRALAQRLSVSATALYWHFKNKDEIVGAMVRHIYECTYGAIDESEGWQACLYTLGRSFRGELGNYRDSVRLIASALPVEDRVASDWSQKISRTLVRGGMEKENALQYEAVVISVVL